MKRFSAVHRPRNVRLDEVVIRPLGPTPGRLIILARKDGSSSRDGDVGGIIKIDMVFPIVARCGNRGIRQPVKREVVKDIVAGKIGAVSGRLMVFTAQSG